MHKLFFLHKTYKQVYLIEDNKFIIEKQSDFKNLKIIMILLICFITFLSIIF